MDWEITTLGGGQFLTLVFNGVAALMGAGSYTRLLGLAMLCGLIGVLVRSAYRGSVMDWQWLLWSILGFYAAFVPVSNVVITDELDPSQSAVVGHVPLGLAATAGISSEAGHWLAEAAETVFSVPDDISYARHGMLFGHRLLDATMRFEITDARLAGNLSEFWQQCVFYDLLLGLYTIGDLEAAPDLWAFVRANTSQARAFSFRMPNGAPTILVCRSGANDELDRGIQRVLPQVTGFYGSQLVQADTRNNAIAQFASAMPVAYQYMTDLSDSASQIILQATLANSMARGIADWAGRVDAPAAIQNYAVARAEAERRSTYAVLGSLAEKYLPLVLHIIQAAVFAVFPVIFILMLMPGGHRAAIAYLKVLAWLSLWPVLFAVLNLGVLVFTRLAAGAALTMPDGTRLLTLANYTGFGHVMSDYALFCGYLMLSIPLLAYYLVDAGGAVLASAAQGIVASYEKPASQAAGEATGGNVALGNVSLDTTRMFQHLSAPVDQAGSVQVTGADGIVRTMTPQGDFVNMPQSSLPLSAMIQKSFVSTLERGSREATRVAEQSAVEASSSVGATLGDLSALDAQLQRTEQFSTSESSSKAAEVRHDVQRVNSLLDTLRVGTDATRAQAAQVALAGSAGVGGKAGAGLPGVASAEVHVNGGVDLRNSDEAGIRKIEGRARETGVRESLASLLGHTARAGSEVARWLSGSTGNAAHDRLSTQLDESATKLERAGVALEHARTFEDALRRVEESGVMTSLRLDDAARRGLAELLDGDAAAAERLIRDGAQGRDPGATVTLDRLLGVVMQRYAERFVASTADGGRSALTVSAGERMDDLRDRAGRLVDGLADRGRMDVDRGARAHDLTRDGIVSEGKEIHASIAGDRASADEQRRLRDREAALARVSALHEDAERFRDAAREGGQAQVGLVPGQVRGDDLRQPADLREREDGMPNP